MLIGFCPRTCANLHEVVDIATEDTEDTEGELGSFRNLPRRATKGTKKVMEPRMDADERGWEVCAHGRDGAQRAEVSRAARVGERVEQEPHKNEVPGGSGIGTGAVRGRGRC